MKKIFFMFAVVLLLPTFAFAMNTSAGQNGAGATASNSTDADDTASQSQGNGNSSSTTSSVTSQSQVENRAQAQVGNPGVGTMTQEQTEARVEEQVQESKPKYSPRNEQASSRMSVVATAAEQLIRVSGRIENQGIGDQIRVIAQTQTKNQDKINQSIDKAETRTGFAKFFIGANFGELKVAKTAIKENRDKIRELKTLMDELTTDTDKLEIANQIMIIQEENLALIDQIEQADDGFSLFGWFSKWIKKY